MNRLMRRGTIDSTGNWGFRILSPMLLMIAKRDARRHGPIGPPTEPLACGNRRLRIIADVTAELRNIFWSSVIAAPE